MASLDQFSNGTPTTKPGFDIVADDINCNTLEVKGVSITPPVTGQYNANFVLTNASGFSDTSGGTQFYQVGDMWTIFGEFKCNLAGVDNFNFDLDLAPGTINTTKRSVQCGSHRVGGQGFLLDIDANTSPTRLSIRMRAAAPATVTGAFFPYCISYRNI